MDVQQGNVYWCCVRQVRVLVQNSSANYVWVRSLYSARLLNLSRLWLVLRQIVVVQTTAAHPYFGKYSEFRFRRKNRTDKQVIDKI